jgi:outer membrane lipoprotein SlyB
VKQQEVELEGAAMDCVVGAFVGETTGHIVGIFVGETTGSFVVTLVGAAIGFHSTAI